VLEQELELRVTFGAMPRPGALEGPRAALRSEYDGPSTDLT
jgi:hypothetical protein